MKLVLGMYNGSTGQLAMPGAGPEGATTLHEVLNREAAESLGYTGNDRPAAAWADDAMQTVWLVPINHLCFKQECAPIRPDAKIVREYIVRDKRSRGLFAIGVEPFDLRDPTQWPPALEDTINPAIPAIPVESAANQLWRVGVMQPSAGGLLVLDFYVIAPSRDLAGSFAEDYAQAALRGAAANPKITVDRVPDGVIRMPPPPVPAVLAPAVPDKSSEPKKETA